MLLLYYDGPCESTMISFSFRYLFAYLRFLEFCFRMALKNHRLIHVFIYRMIILITAE